MSDPIWLANMIAQRRVQRDERLSEIFTVSAPITLIAAAAALLLSAASQAAFVVDNFTDNDSVSAGGNATVTGGAVALTGTALTVAARQFSVTSSGIPAAIEAITAGVSFGSVLAISNNAFATGTAKVIYNFANIDLAVIGPAIILDVLAIDLNVSVNIIGNGTSSSGFQTFAGPGQFFKNFSGFSDPTQFTHLTSLELDFKGPKSWDGTFSFLTVDTPGRTPEPGSIALVGLAGLGLVAARRRKV